MAQYKDYYVVGKIVPLNSGTRMRVDASTFTHVINSYAKDAQVTIDLVREYTETVTSEYVRLGDKWGRVLSVNDVAVSQPAWMAITYLGSPICTPAYSLATTPVEPVPSEKVKIEFLTVVTTYEDGTTETADFYPEV